MLGAVFSTDPLLTVLQEIMTETGIWDPHSNEACVRSILGHILVNSEVNLRSILANSRKPHGNLMETSKKPHGNLMETSWKPLKAGPCRGLRARGMVFGHSGSGTLNTLCIPYP